MTMVLLILVMLISRKNHKHMMNHCYAVPPECVVLAAGAVAGCGDGAAGCAVGVVVVVRGVVLADPSRLKLVDIVVHDFYCFDYSVLGLPVKFLRQPIYKVVLHDLKDSTR